MTKKAFQDYYPEETSYCYGCGRNNDDGLHLKSYWDENSEESIAVYTPRPEHMALPGYVYGGLIASIIDCHGTGTAAATAYRAAGRDMGTKPDLRFVTGKLSVKYLRPTPLGVPLTLRGKVAEQKERKIVITQELYANDELCATGEIIAILLPEGAMSSK